MNYTINVSLNGRHYFATSKRSLTVLDNANALFDHFDKLFPKEDGFALTLAVVLDTRGTIRCRDL